MKMLISKTVKAFCKVAYDTLTKPLGETTVDIDGDNNEIVVTNVRKKKGKDEKTDIYKA